MTVLASSRVRAGAEPHLNTCFKHYMYFVYEFNLIPKREELQPLQANTHPSTARAVVRRMRPRPVSAASRVNSIRLVRA